MSAGTLNLTVKTLTGHSETFQISRNATVLDLKRLIPTKMPDVPYYRARLTSSSRPGGALDDDSKPLSYYSSVTSGTTLFLLVEKPFKVYVQDPETKIFEVEIPLSDPKMYPMTDLRELVEGMCGRSLSNYQFKFNGKPLDELNHGRKFTLGDHGINKEDTIFLMKLGFSLNITQPMVDICFMMDCTGSMGSWIESVKSNITTVRNRLETQYKGCDLQVSFVRYTDYDQPESTRTTWLNFTKSLPNFHNFVNPIVANGGGDGPEDIMGALKVTLSNLSWRSSSAKVLIHIADAPCHGGQYHSMSDDHPNGDPAGITHDRMMQEIAQKGIQYWFGYINQDSTDKMIGIFNDSLKVRSSQTLLIRQFNATDPKQLAEAIHKSVTASVTANEAKKASTQTISSSEVNWGVISVRQAVKTSSIGTKSIQELRNGLKFGAPTISFSLKLAPNPFSDGEESVVYKALDTSRSCLLSMKQLKAAGNQFDKYVKVQEIQVISSTYAQLFNSSKPSGYPEVEFIAVDIVEVNGTYYISQEFVSGNFEKFNTNNGIVCPDPPHSDLMQAFSHFTFVKSDKSILICDLEGVVSGGRVRLVDPAIHNRTCPKKYGPTDTGFLGIKRFFGSHECKSICQSMGLHTIKA